MKFTFAFIFVVISVCLFDAITAAPELRQKRAVFLERCEQNVDCKAYAEKKTNERKSCLGYVVRDQEIEWQSCGTIGCGKGLKLAPGDLNKSYPECCPKCVSA